MYGKGEGMMFEVDIFPPNSSPLLHNMTTPPDTSTNISVALKAQVMALMTKSHNKPTDIDMWHHCLGHVSYDTIQQMSKDDIIQGMHLTNPTPHPGMCEDCIMGKHTCRPFHAYENHETTIGEHTYVDLWGPSCVQSTGRCSYRMPCVDGYSGHIKTYFLPNKEAAMTLDALRHYIALTKQQTRQKVKKIQTDEGMEFTNNLSKTYLNEQGIIHEFTTAYSSASNGVIECSHHTIIEHVCICLHEARLPPSL